MLDEDDAEWLGEGLGVVGGASNGLAVRRGGHRRGRRSFGLKESGGGGRWREISPERSSRARSRAEAVFRCLWCKRRGAGANGAGQCRARNRGRGNASARALC